MYILRKNSKSSSCIHESSSDLFNCCQLSLLFFHKNKQFHKAIFIFFSVALYHLPQMTQRPLKEFPIKPLSLINIANRSSSFNAHISVQTFPLSRQHISHKYTVTTSKLQFHNSNSVLLCRYECKAIPTTHSSLCCVSCVHTDGSNCLW